MDNKYEHYLTPVMEIARSAGWEILKIYARKGAIDFKVKADNSPLTEADLVAHDLIYERLSKLTPDIPILSEEQADIPYEIRKTWERYWLVDPLDGTQEFLERTGQFTVNIALVENHKAVLGVSFPPVIGRCFYATSGGDGAFSVDGHGFVNRLHTHKISDRKLKVIASKRLDPKLMDQFLAKLPEYELVYFGGSVKLCMIAEGVYDLYPRFGPNYEWDTAAGQCIVEEAGGAVVDFNFKPLRYNTKESLLNPHFLVVGDPAFLSRGNEG